MRIVKIKNEKLFAALASPNRWVAVPDKWEVSEKGRAQFMAHQSQGIYPENPDPYFFVLEGGKKEFDWLTRELQQSYQSQSHWWGLFALWEDWKGERWILKHLLRWWPKEHKKQWDLFSVKYAGVFDFDREEPCHNLPRWITCEGITLAESEAH